MQEDEFYEVSDTSQTKLEGQVDEATQVEERSQTQQEIPIPTQLEYEQKRESKPVLVASYTDSDDESDNMADEKENSPFLNIQNSAIKEESDNKESSPFLNEESCAPTEAALSTQTQSSSKMYTVQSKLRDSWKIEHVQDILKIASVGFNSVGFNPRDLAQALAHFVSKKEKPLKAIEQLLRTEFPFWSGWFRCDYAHEENLHEANSPEFPENSPEFPTPKATQEIQSHLCEEVRWILIEIGEKAGQRIFKLALMVPQPSKQLNAACIIHLTIVQGKCIAYPDKTDLNLSDLLNRAPDPKPNDFFWYARDSPKSDLILQLDKRYPNLEEDELTQQSVAIIEQEFEATLIEIDETIHHQNTKRIDKSNAKSSSQEEVDHQKVKIVPSDDNEHTREQVGMNKAALSEQKDKIEQSEEIDPLADDDFFSKSNNIENQHVFDHNMEDEPPAFYLDDNKKRSMEQLKEEEDKDDEYMDENAEHHEESVGLVVERPLSRGILRKQRRRDTRKLRRRVIEDDDDDDKEQVKFKNTVNHENDDEEGSNNDDDCAEDGSNKESEDEEKNQVSGNNKKAVQFDTDLHLRHVEVPSTMSSDDYPLNILTIDGKKRSPQKQQSPVVKLSARGADGEEYEKMRSILENAALKMTVAAGRLLRFSERLHCAELELSLTEADFETKRVYERVKELRISQDDQEELLATGKEVRDIKNSLNFFFNDKRAMKRKVLPESDDDSNDDDNHDDNNDKMDDGAKSRMPGSKQLPRKKKKKDTSERDSENAVTTTGLESVSHASKAKKYDDSKKKFDVLITHLQENHGWSWKKGTKFNENFLYLTKDYVLPKSEEQREKDRNKKFFDNADDIIAYADKYRLWPDNVLASQQPDDLYDSEDDEDYNMHPHDDVKKPYPRTRGKTLTPSSARKPSTRSTTTTANTTTKKSARRLSSPSSSRKRRKGTPVASSTRTQALLTTTNSKSQRAEELWRSAWQLLVEKGWTWNWLQRSPTGKAFIRPKVSLANIVLGFNAYATENEVITALIEDPVGPDGDKLVPLTLDGILADARLLDPEYANSLEKRMKQSHFNNDISSERLEYARLKLKYIELEKANAPRALRTRHGNRSR
uniref:Uncharacterized protein n=1 Tax=Aureoumbra lagunensis TaxID=44058 RepID=A0A7S3JVB7_9STRA|mmetsp:Transcript_3147/g.4837  ORF Transcript_3147/g.4837 Transcript_3147/m.4837 type:complete len:1106 (+) Transcript_3147:115-3432(+)